MSVDPLIQSPANSQSLNPYSYLMNNPLSGTDPTGYKGEEIEEKVEDIAPVTGSRLGGKKTTKITTNADGSRSKKVTTSNGAGQRTGFSTSVAKNDTTGGGNTNAGSLAGRDKKVGGGVGGNTNKSFNLFDPSTYPGVDAGENAAMYWAQKHVETGNPLYAIPGVFASLWTPKTAGETALTLSGEGLFAVGARIIGAVRGANVGTEIVQRGMSRAELKATQETGLIRGGRDGTHYVTDALNSTSKRAQQRLALPQGTDVGVTMRVPKGAFSTPSRVKPRFKMPGGGMERTSTGQIPVEILKVKGM